MMRRTILLLAAMALTLLVASGIALAVNKVGTQGRDLLTGTDGADTLVGRGGNDRIFSLAGKDTLIGGPGKDWIFGGSIRSSHRTVWVGYTFSWDEKNVVGGAGNDVVWGGLGSDDVVGGGGNDALLGGKYRESTTTQTNSGSDAGLIL
jgi:Ca2+-binding RTX toxin-like protein